MCVRCTSTYDYLVTLYTLTGTLGNGTIVLIFNQVAFKNLCHAAKYLRIFSFFLSRPDCPDWRQPRHKVKDPVMPDATNPHDNHSNCTDMSRGFPEVRSF